MAEGLSCLRCQAPLKDPDRWELKEGHGGYAGVFLGNLSEDAIAVDVYVCPRCRHIEFFAPANKDA